jgi:hypothetical protein
MRKNERRRRRGLSAKRSRPGRRRILAAKFAASALAAGAVPATASADTATDLGNVGFGTIAVSNELQRVFVSAPLANKVDEFDFKGQLIGSIPNIYGAWGMAISSGYLYVTETTTGELVRLKLGASSPTPEQVASGLNHPQWLVMTGGRLWTTEDPTGQWGSVMSVDPSSGATAALPGSYYQPDLAVSPGDPNTLFVAEDGLSPGAIFRFDVSTSPATKVASNTFTDQSNIENVAVSSDGKRVIPASGAPYLFEELDAYTLQPDGLRYPGNPYPSAVAVSSSGLLATGLNNGYSNPDITTYALGKPAATFTASTNNPDGTANVLPHGLALSKNGDSLFAITAGQNNHVLMHAYKPAGTKSMG